MAVTLRRLPHELHVTKYNRFSPLLSSVSGDRQVLQVTYSTMKVQSKLCRCLLFTLNTGAFLHTNISSQDVLNLLVNPMSARYPGGKMNMNEILFVESGP